MPFEGISSAVCGSLSCGGDGRLFFLHLSCSSVFFPFHYIFHIFTVCVCMDKTLSVFIIKLDLPSFVIVNYSPCYFPSMTYFL